MSDPEVGKADRHVRSSEKVRTYSQADIRNGSRKRLLSGLIGICVVSVALFCLSLRMEAPWRLVQHSIHSGIDQGQEISWPSYGGDEPHRLHPEDHVYRSAKTLRYHWNVTLETRRPDGVARPVFLVNGNFPGPTIEARPGDEIIVEVYNRVETEEPISIHWHGLYMKGYNDMDGVVGLTQRGIAPGDSFTYRFPIDDRQAGTFWYHGHAGGQLADGLFGGLVVHEPATRIPESQIDPEYLFLIGDWYHRRAKEMMEWYMDSSHFANEPGPDSMLINGQGHFDCSMATKARPVDCIAVPKPNISLSGDRVKIRVVNFGALTGFTFGVSDVSMQLTHLDGGHPVVDAPAAERLGILYPGERFEAIVRPTWDAGERRLTVSLDKELLRIKNFALTETQSFPLLWAPSGSVAPPPEPRLDITSVNGPDINLPHEVSHKTVFYANMEIRATLGDRPVGVVNHTSWHVDDPYATPMITLAPSERPTFEMGHNAHPGQLQLHIPRFEYQRNGDRWIEITINNVDDRGHPFHLHGHSFYVLAVHGSQTRLEPLFNPFVTDSPPGTTRNLVNPIRKDTVWIPRMGFAVIRFELDNDGLWMLHCHALWHHMMGMATPIEISAAP